jgi:hypothetical protein
VLKSEPPKPKFPEIRPASVFEPRAALGAAVEGRGEVNSAGGSARRAADTFDAFISYGHAADGRLAPALQTGLERLASPWYRRRVLRVFRDDVGLSVNPDLWGSIRDALDRSEWFVLLLSPQAAASPWVNEEITHWLSTKPVERILLVQTDGMLAWDGEKGDFDPERSSCVPPALVGRVRAEPRHLDLTWARGESQLDRHSVRARRAAFAGLAALLALAIAASVLAFAQRDRAQHQTAVAKHQTDVAVSQRLAIQAASLAPRKLDLALLLAVAGHRLDNSPRTGQGLLAALSQSPQLRGFDHRFGGNIGTMALSPDDRTLVVAEEGGTLHIVEPRTDHPLRAPLEAPTRMGAVLAAAFSPNGRWLAIAGDGGSLIYDARTFRTVGRFLSSRGWVENIAFSPDSARLATSSSKGYVRVRSTVDGRPTAPPVQVSTSWTTAISFSPNGRRLLVGLCYSFAAGEEGELVEVDGLAAVAAAAVPTGQQGLQQQHRLGQCQAGRCAFGSSRSSVRKACAQVTSAQ